MCRARHTVGFHSACILSCGSLGSNHFSQKFESILWPMPKQGGPYSWASASTLGTLGPSRQIGLISSESVSCESPFNSGDKHCCCWWGWRRPTEQPFTGCLPISPHEQDGWTNCRLCFSGKAGPSTCRLPFREGAVRKGCRQESQSQHGPKMGGEGAAESDFSDHGQGEKEKVKAGELRVSFRSELWGQAEKGRAGEEIRGVGNWKEVRSNMCGDLQKWL